MGRLGELPPEVQFGARPGTFNSALTHDTKAHHPRMWQ